MSTNEEAQPAGTLGIERWVQFAFIGGALLTFWLYDHLFADLAEFIALKANVPTPAPTLITAGSAIAAILTMVICYRSKKLYGFTHEVAVELAHVTWPTRQETWSNTVVVFIVSIISATIIGLFDAAWSAITDLIY
ncbi:MAG: preprotein translocase subunit SecE [Myxococcales bacterium]|nr:preprotein translocase subunit SecE [Myxococcales bacterium]